MSTTQEKAVYSNAWILLLASLTALGPLSIDMYLPALPQMANDFGVSTQMVANSLPAYFLGLAIGQLIYGPVSDRIGRKKPLYFGLSLYIIASLLCVFANSEWSLIAARVLQALGGCVGVVIARAAIRDRLDMQAKACKDLSSSILNRQTYTHNKRFKHAFENLRLSLEKLRDEQQYDQIWVNALFSLYQNLKSIDAQLRNLETERNIKLDKAKHIESQLKDDDLKGWDDIKVRIKQHLTPESVLFRHAIRLSIVLLVGYIFVQVTNIEYGYWILLTALFVSQPNFNATKRRLRLRIVGTLVGIILGYAVLYFVPSIEGQLLVLVISGVLFFELRSKQYAQATAFITILALINFNLDGMGYEAALPRMMDTLIGCGLAWLGVSFIFPDWKFRRLPRTIYRSLSAQCDYLAEVIEQYKSGRNNGLNYRVVRRAAHNTDAEVASLISTLATEPDFDPTQKSLAFEFLCLNHTFISYIAALGAHREKIDDPQILELMDRAFDNIQGALLRDEMPDLTAQNMLQTIRQRLSQNNEEDQKALIILQQLSLMFSILNQFSRLKQSLSHERDHEATELASL